MYRKQSEPVYVLFTVNISRTCYVTKLQQLHATKGSILTFKIGKMQSTPQIDKKSKMDINLAAFINYQKCYKRDMF